ncbi:MAG: SDR family oxidoreductase [Hyphomicrobiaceae bacterium]|nr:SDR family oxidoreductase [Hyphomicrobiaceae bacterium]
MSDAKAGRVALVTGASHRIGRHIALDLAAHGWAVGVHYNSSKEAALEVVALIEKDGGRALALKGDLDDEAQVRELIPALGAQFGAVNLLVNNASMFDPDKLQSLGVSTEGDPVGGMLKYHQQLQVNLTAPLMLSQAIVEQLPQEIEGNIINILDQKVWRLTPYYMSYTLSKSALWTATRTLAQALSPHTRVNAIGPGPILPNKRQTQEEFEGQCAKLPLKRCATPEHIARTIRFIVEMPSMTGQMIALDGGRHLAWNTPDVTNKHD